MMIIYIISGTLLLFFDLIPNINKQTRYSLGAVLIVYGLYRGFRSLSKRRQTEN
ncbi:MAG: hypothetical protein ACK4GL_12480 [Flavobacteriales bacterium]